MILQIHTTVRESLKRLFASSKKSPSPASQSNTHLSSTLYQTQTPTSSLQSFRPPRRSFPQLRPPTYRHQHLRQLPFNRSFSVATVTSSTLPHRAIPAVSWRIFSTTPDTITRTKRIPKNPYTDRCSSQYKTQHTHAACEEIFQNPLILFLYLICKYTVNHCINCIYIINHRLSNDIIYNHRDDTNKCDIFCASSNYI